MPAPKSKSVSAKKTVKTRSPAQKANDLKLKKMHSVSKVLNSPSKYVKSVATKSNAKKAAGLASLISLLGAGYYLNKRRSKYQAPPTLPESPKASASSVHWSNERYGKWTK